MKTRAAIQLLSMVVTSVVLFCTSAVQAQTVDDIVKKGKVVIGVQVGSPPFDTVDEKGNHVGYNFDVANLLGKYLGVKVEIVELAVPARIAALTSGKVDMLVALMGLRPEWAKSVMYTQPYCSFDHVIWAAKSADIKSLDDLKGKKVSLPRGSTQEGFLNNMKIPGMTLSRFDDDASAAQALLSGQVDASADPDVMVKEFMKQSPDGKFEVKFQFMTVPCSMTVRKDAFELHQWLNTTIAWIKTNGELDQIHMKWFGKPVSKNLPIF